jgi:hypothetical protein
MDYNEHIPHIDLEGLPSDAFESDFDVDPHLSVSDYSSWPAESSPPPLDAQEEEEEQEEEEQEEEEGIDDEIEEEVEEEEEEAEGYYSEHEIEDDFADQEDEDHEIYDEHEDDDEFEYVLEEELEEQPEPGQDGWEGEDYWQSEAESENSISGIRQRSPRPRAGRSPTFDDFLAGDDSLFVDQGPGIILPPLENLLSSVRRHHARALDLLHSEIRRQDHTSLGGLGRASAGPSRENHRHNHRHHPYNMPRIIARDPGRMADHRDRRNNDRFGDELIAVEMEPSRAPLHRNRSPPRAQPEIIDLTGEPDSPDEPRVVPPPRARGSNPVQIQARHPRRQLSLGQRTPSLSRSDGSLLGNNPNVIDLTLDDSPAPPPLPQQLPRRNHPDNNHNHHRHNHHQSHRRPAPLRPQPIDLDDQEGFGARFAGLVRGFGLLQRLVGGHGPNVEVQVLGARGLNMDNPIAGNIPNLNYRGNGQNGGAAKPEHVPPPPAREGFTRDTGSADDVVICPGCELELKYDPDAANDTVSPRPAKKLRSKKDQEEHHFWALKDCGHVSLPMGLFVRCFVQGFADLFVSLAKVYCKDCYESRGRGGSKNSTVVWRRDDKSALLCTVDGCLTKVNNKSNWVGLFL